MRVLIVEDNEFFRTELDDEALRLFLRNWHIIAINSALKVNY